MPANERAAIQAELTPPFTIARPCDAFSPFVFCSPHSGRVYPRRFLQQSRLNPHTLRKSEDCFVDELFAGVTLHGAPLIAARFPRAYLDVNREPYELDPYLFNEPVPDYANCQSTRVVGGLGTIARIVADGEEIYARRMSLAAGLERIEGLYRPFHRALNELIDEARTTFGYAILIDCHSMPSSSMTSVAGRRPDIVLGDRFGASCDPRITAFTREAFSDLGYNVQINRPYAGGFITEHYGQPLQHSHALQIEINRGLYCDEGRLTRTAGFDKLRYDLDVVTARMLFALPLLLESRQAAE